MSILWKPYVKFRQDNFSFTKIKKYPPPAQDLISYHKSIIAPLKELIYKCSAAKKKEKKDILIALVLLIPFSTLSGLPTTSGRKNTKIYHCYFVSPAVFKTILFMFTKQNKKINKKPITPVYDMSEDKKLFFPFKLCCLLIKIVSHCIFG